MELGQFGKSRIHLSYIICLAIAIRMCRDLVADGFSNDYIYDCLISKHVSPFTAQNLRKVILPGKRTDGRWRGLSDEEIVVEFRDVIHFL